MELFKEFDPVDYQKWIDKITLDLKGKNYEDTLVWKSNEGIVVQPFYNNDTLETNNVLNQVPLKEKQAWEIRETITIDSIEAANKKALLALKGGANSISFVGKIESQEEMDQLLQGILTDIIDLHFYTPTPIKTFNYVTPQQGSICYDFIGEQFIANSSSANQETTISQLTEITRNSNSSIKTIAINGNNYHNAGATIIQELAFTLSHGVEYLNLLTDKDLAVNAVAPKMQFTFAIGVNYFFEIAKIRAARLIWQAILASFEAQHPKQMYIHSVTAQRNLTEKDTHFNILRTTTESMSAIIGGCDSLTVLPYDKTVHFSDRIARNIQHLLKEEAFLDKVKNAADGAYYIEQLTDEIAQKSWQLFQEIEQQGGFIACLENNFISDEIKKVTTQQPVINN